MRTTLARICLLIGALTPATALADLADTLSRFLGYSNMASKTVAGYRDRDGKKGDSFEGCDWDRIIIFTDNTYVTCRTYSYSYSYRPTAVIIVRGSSLKLIVGSDAYDVDR